MKSRMRLMGRLLPVLVFVVGLFAIVGWVTADEAEESMLTGNATAVEYALATERLDVAAVDATPIIDGVVDPSYGMPIASDPQDSPQGNNNMDLGDIYVTHDADNIYIAFTVYDDVATTNWGKYIMYIDTTNDAAGATSDAWGRNVIVTGTHKPEYSINSWLDAAPYGAEDMQFWAWDENGSSWNAAGTIVTEAALGAGSSSVIEWKLSRAELGDPNSIWLEVYSTGGGDNDPAQDTINSPADDWTATDWSTQSVLLNSTEYGLDIAVDGVIESLYGAPVASDPQDSPQGNNNLDLGDLYISHDQENVYVAFTVYDDVATTNWGKYIMYIDTTNDAAGATSDAWGRNVIVTGTHKPEYSINSWLDAAPYGAEDMQFWAWDENGSSWNAAGTIVTEAALGAGSSSVIEWKLSRAELGDPNSIWLEVYSTGGGDNDPAQDTINDPADDWTATDWSTQSVLLNSTEYGLRPTVDGVVDSIYGAPAASDPQDSPQGNNNLDLGDLYLAHDAENLYVAFTIYDDVGATNWGKYIMYIDTTNDAAGATSDAWGRNVIVTGTHKPEYSINSWLDAAPYGAEDMQFWAWDENGSSWNAAGNLVSDAALGAGSTSVVEWQLSLAEIGHPDEVWVEVYSTGGGDNDPAQDTINDPADDWTATDWSTQAVLLNSTYYMLPGGGDNGGTPIDESLVAAPVSFAVQDDVFYFVLPDRFANGDMTNDEGAAPGGTLTETGYLVDDKAFYHGGDFVGLQSKLDYLEGMGVSAIWVTPPFKNLPTQDDGSTAFGIGAAYHGYWILDFESADPHLGTNQELINFIDEAHSRDIKVYFDIVVNHTADVIKYQENNYSYRDKEDYPYRDSSGTEFDDRDFVGMPFPALSTTVSFPYTPVFQNPGDDTAKNPAWLNDPTLYHNRGDSTFAGESSQYGDFFGLDDLFTENPVVVDGYIDIFTKTIELYNIDGFRIDTVKHVNTELWIELAPAVMEYAQANGKDDFYMFGEVFDSSAALMSHYTTEGDLPSVLDFGMHGNALGFAVRSEATSNLEGFFAADDYFTDANSNAYGLANFISNHDIGRVGREVMTANGGASDAELVARSELAHALMFFSRGFPVVYYGDEQGFTGDGGDKDAREDMFASQVAVYNDNNLIGTTATTADDNFDTDHPIYQTIMTYTQVYSDHNALRRGAQIHRYSEGNAGIYAFSRIDRDEKVEYIIALNNSEAADSATFDTYLDNGSFTQIYPGSGPVVMSDGTGQVTVTVPALDFVIYRADTALPEDETPAPTPTITSLTEGQEVFGRIEVGVDLDTTDRFVEVTFSAKIGEGEWEIIGTDTNAPYRIFYDVSDVPLGTTVEFQAIVKDLCSGELSNTTIEVQTAEEPSTEEQYVIIHYKRFDGDYGDFSSSDFNDFWGLHLWGSALHPDELPVWDDPKRFSGFDDYGAFVALRLVDPTQLVNFIVHRGNAKDGTEADRSFDPAETPEIWLLQDDPNHYGSRAEAEGTTLVHYNRDDTTYTDWGLHLWQDGSASLTNWPEREMSSRQDDFGAVYSVTTDVYPTLEFTRGLNFIVHNGMGSQEPQRTYTPTVNYEVWVNSADDGWYAEEGAATSTATIHYRRCLGDYGDYDSTNYNDFWGMHLWAGADPDFLNSISLEWTNPLKPVDEDGFGVIFEIELAEGAKEMAYILHRGDEKDVGPDQFLDFDDTGYEIWIVEGAGGDNELSATIQFTEPAIAWSIAERICSGASVGDINQPKGYWLAADTIGWTPVSGADDTLTYMLYSAPNGGLELSESGITGGTAYTLTVDADGLTDTIATKFPHLASQQALKIDMADWSAVPEILKGQIAIAAYDGDMLIDATGLQIPGVLDDLYTYAGELGVVWQETPRSIFYQTEDVPSIHLWAPTAKSVTLHLFDDAISSTVGMTMPMSLDVNNGVWFVDGDSNWKGKYYLFEVEVYVHATGQVERNIVTDPYSFSLAMNSARSQIIDLSDPMLKPAGWDDIVKPELERPEDISVYELHIRDFSVFDETVAEADRGKYTAFTYDGQSGRPGPSNGMAHLLALQEAGLSHVHLLPAFDIATINEDPTKRIEPDPAVLATYAANSDEQQALISATGDQDAFNWGYDPFHYTTPEGSYSTDPDGSQRIVEFREMVQVLNENGFRVVMDVVYNHTNAAGQSNNSVLDRIVPGYYHRLNDRGQVESSTCCANTATEHNMMEKLMVDSLEVWAAEYKVDAFRFDLMGHHMKRNMLKVRDSLDALTIAEDGVDGSEIFMYGEGWNFGEVANNARGENATQANMAGTGIGTFSDRLRDAVRGGGCCPSGNSLYDQGFGNGLYYDPNAVMDPSGAFDSLLLAADQIRVGLAGNLKDYIFEDRTGTMVTGAQVPYGESPAGYTDDPQEIITYISKHDNQTLYDINAYGLPVTTTIEQRARAQVVGLSLVTLGQGVPFYHAGSDMLRSKSMDRDSFNSGDWFNRLDFTYMTNNFGVGLPVESKNGSDWPFMTGLLANPALKADQANIAMTAEMFRDFLAIRSSSELFRLETKEAVMERVAFHNTGPGQVPGLIVMSISDLVAAEDIDPQHELIVAIFNANDEAQTITVAELAGLNLTLHPVQAASNDAVVKTTAFDSMTGEVTVPGRTTAVMVLEQTNLAVAHLAPFASSNGDGRGLVDLATAVDIKLDGTQILTGVEYLQAIAYLPVSDGEHTVEVFPSGTMTAVMTSTVNLAAGEDYTIVAIGDGTNQPLELKLLTDDNTMPASGFAHVRVGHVAPFASSLMDTMADIRLSDGTPVVTNVQYADVTAMYLELPADTYDLNVTTPGGGQVLIDLAPVTLESGDVVTIFAVGDGVNQPLQGFAHAPLAKTSSEIPVETYRIYGPWVFVAP